MVKNCSFTNECQQRNSSDAPNGTKSDAPIPEMLLSTLGEIFGALWVFQMLVAGLPAADSHLQGVVRGEQSRQ